MILYGCNSQPPNLNHGDIVQECESMPPGCSNMLWAWAKGSLPLQFPDDIGMPIGQDLQWTALQLHYYNPNLDTGKVDSSGVTMDVANKPMTHDAAMFVFNGGTGPGQRDPIPAGQKSFTLDKMLVPKDCTNAWTAELNILSAVHHQHLVGKQMKLEVSRGGKHLGVLRHEHHYDFNHQSLEESPIKTLKVGDEILMTCEYDTSKKSTPTEFGDQTQNEMCYALVMYYPAQKMSSARYVKKDGGKTSCAGQTHTVDISSFPKPDQCVQKGDISSTAADTLASAIKAGTKVTLPPSITLPPSAANPTSNAGLCRPCATLFGISVLSLVVSSL